MDILPLYLMLRTDCLLFCDCVAVSTNFTLHASDLGDSTQTAEVKQ